MRLGYHLHLWGLFALPVVLAQGIDYSAAAQSISAALADPSFVPYTRPNQKITEFIALGDSYTAGTGCNGIYEQTAGDAIRGMRAYPRQMAQDADNWGFINNDDTLPRFSFHAYTGATVDDLVIYQLKQGAYKDHDDLARYQPFGKPQIAVVTIGGNDARLSEVLNACVYDAWKPKNCNTLLKDIENDLDPEKGKFQQKVNLALYEVAHAGRLAGGAEPRESFQVFVLEYLTFFSDAMGPECNDYTWCTWPFCTGPKLTEDLRKRLNKLVREANEAIKRAAEPLKRMGVIYVEGIQDIYNGHRYCEQGASSKMNEYSVWFWSPHSGIDTPSEGPGDPSNSWSEENIDLAQGLLDFIFPGQGKLVSDLSADGPQPWEWEGAEKFPTLQSLLDAVQAASDDVDAQFRAPFPYLRSFHPKATAYSQHAQTLFAAIADNRDTVVTGNQGQQIAIASYINPLGDPASWERLLAYDTQKVSVLVANVLNGPDYVIEDSWKSVIDRAASQGKKIIGYVRTGYLGVSQQQFTTRLGSRDLADWASQIEQDIDKWYELYGNSLGGIFFDEGWPECGPNNIYADLYAYIDEYTKRKHPGAYTSSFVPNDWTPKDPRKIWHIIYKVPQDQIANVAALAKSRNVGLIEITDDVQPNPYDNLPNESYMQAVIGAVKGGKPPVRSPAQVTNSYIAGIPSDVAVSSSDYSSVTLTWSAVANALGYAVYMNGKQVLELPASLTRATVGMIEPGTSGISFEVRTVLSSGSGGGSWRTISASTKSLPEDGSIASVGFNLNGDTVTYTADVLVPYAFVRLFIGKDQPDPGIGRGWPIQAPPDVTGRAQHQIVNYLVEGNDFYSGLYKYAGAWYETTSANADWTWSSIGEAKQTQNGYTYTWVVPLGGTDAVAKEYVIQGQGYAPIKNVFKGTLRHFGTV
ncbi:SGNH hydrolase-type esterase domain-containing protein [Aspergillus pseudodeflectus]|uniref:SGNH hydrolase-type esterase domain-containing protein n=1 Tax=Aspergillus pseudodeflectus TaxID=176178 RepID=A0ABR4KV13_9EURO